MAIEHQEWLNQNSYRAYPIKEQVSRYAVDDAGLFLTDIRIPNNVLVDFVLTVAGSTEVRIYVSRMALIGTFLSFEFKDYSDVTVATLAVDTASHTAYDHYSIIGSGDYEDARGTVVLGDLTNLRKQYPEGSFGFSLATAELEPATVRPDLRGVRSLQSDTNGELSARLFGHVRLVAGENIRLTLLEAENTIRIDAIDAAGFEDACACEDAFQLPCIRSINGISVEDVQITGDKCIQVDTSGNQITLSDRCSAPCCGCIELEFLTSTLNLLEHQLSRMEGYAEEMRSRLIEFITNVLVSI